MRTPRKSLLVWITVSIYLFSMFVPVAVGAVPTTNSSEQMITSPKYRDLADDDSAIFIKYLTRRGLVKGYPDGTFHPERGVTRAESVAIISSVLGLPVQSTVSKFKDVSSKHWAAPFISAAYKAGMLKGYPDGNFRPDKVITRAEGISLLLRLSSGQLDEAELPELKDLKTGHWAASQIAVGLDSKMMITANNSYFSPNAPFTRGDLARALSILLVKDPLRSRQELSNKLTIVDGKVSVTSGNSTVDFSVNDNVRIKTGDCLTTGSGSTAELTFPDGSGILIKENTEVVIGESWGRSYIKPDSSPGVAVEWFAMELKRGKIFGTLATAAEPSSKKNTAEKENTDSTAKAENRGNLRLQALASAPKSKGAVPKAGPNTAPKSGQGAAPKSGQGTPPKSGQGAAKKSNSGGIVPWWKTASAKKVRVRVDMPWGVAAVRGTFWENEVVPGKYNKTTVLTGNAELISGGQTVSLVEGQRTEVRSPAAPPAPAATFNETDKKEWLEVKEWAQDRAQDIQKNQDGLAVQLAINAQPVVEGEVPVVNPDLPVTDSEIPAPNQLMDSVNQAFDKVETGSTSVPASGGGGGGSSDTAPPTVTLTNPADGSSRIAVNSSIQIDFNERVLAGINVNNITVETGSVPITFNKTFSGSRLTLTPNQALQYSATYTVTVPSQAVKDSSGNQFQGPYSFSFTTRDILAFRTAIKTTVELNSSGPVDAVTGQFSSDNVPDLAVAVEDFSTPNITLLQGTGDGNFNVTGHVYLNNVPRAIATGDFNGDSRPDLAAVSMNNVSIMYGNVSYGFNAPTDYAMGSELKDITVGYFNGDSISDLAVVCGMGHVYVLTGKSGGGFDSFGPYEVPTGNNPVSITANKFNNDNLVDLAVLNTTNNTVSIFLGNGDGSFATNPVNSGEPSSFGAMAAGYFDAGSVYDIALVHQFNGLVQLMFGNGDGSAAVAGNVYGFAEHSKGIAVGDFSLDSRDDIVVVSQPYDGMDGQDQDVAILAGNGDGTFHTPLYIGTDRGLVGVIAGDMNNDSKADIIVLSSHYTEGSRYIAVLLNDN